MRTLRRRRPPPVVRGSHWNLRTATIVPPSAHRAITPRSCQRKPLPVVKGLNVACIASADRKSTRVNSSHVAIPYAVFCLKKKNAIRLGPPETESGGSRDTRTQFTQVL